MITMIYRGCEIEALPELDPENHQWLVRLKISRHERGKCISKLFSLPETFPTQKETINYCWDYGQKIIDGGITDFLKANH